MIMTTIFICFLAETHAHYMSCCGLSSSLSMYHIVHLPGAVPATSGPGCGQQMRRSRLSPHTFSRTCPMIFRFLATSEVSLARLSCEMMGAQVLMGTHALLMGHVEIESAEETLHQCFNL